jgi:HK97 family phage major capsid protein
MGKSSDGFFMPTNIQFAREMNYGERAQYAAGAPATGGTLVASNLMAGSFIEVLRNKARVMGLGATVLSGLVGNVDIPRQTSATGWYWVGEGGTLTESEATFDKVSMSIKHIGTYSAITRQMLMQSTPDIEMLVRADLIAQIALGLDAAALYGTGSGANMPLGIANQSGVSSVAGGVNGAQLTIDHLIDLETNLANANAAEDNLAYLTSAKAIGWLKKAKATSGQYLWTNSPGGQRSNTPGEINGYQVARTNIARSNLTKGTATTCSEVYFGNWSELLIGEWGVLEIVPNPYDSTAFKQGGILLRAMQSIDVQVRHAASFSIMSDALTA